MSSTTYSNTPNTAAAPLGSYKGNLPYIFISYAHADSRRVYPVIKKLQEDGFRVWYDDGIDPGTEWDQSIADAIKNCGYFFAFLSENYLRSENCKDEMNYARDLNPTPRRLLLYLEDVALTEGMELRQSRIQAVHCYTYDSQAQMFARIYEATDIEKCHEKNKKPMPPLGADRENGSPHGPEQEKKKKVWLIPAGIAAVVLVVSAVILVPKIFGKPSPEPEEETAAAPTAAEEPEPAKEEPVPEVVEEEPVPDVKLTSIQDPVEYENFSIQEEIRNTVGSSYEKAVVLSGWNSAYVRYNVGDFKQFAGTYSIPAEAMESGDEYTLRIYLDEEEEEPFLKEKLTRSTPETELDIDVSGAQFITFTLEGDRNCGLMLTDCYLGEAIDAKAIEKTGTSLYDDREDIALTAVEMPAESSNFSIPEEVSNTMGSAYEKAVLLSGWQSAYVRYYVGDIRKFTGTYSVPTDGTESGDEFTLRIYLDKDAEEPILKEKLSRSTVETELDIDVSEAEFITFELEGDRNCGLLLTDCYLNKSGTVSAQDTGTSLYDEKDGIMLTSVEKPVESSNFSIPEEVLNTMGTTYEKAVRLSGWQSAYVRYNVGDFSRFVGTYSVPNEGMDAEEEYTLVIYLDEEEEEPYWRGKVTRSTPETGLNIDVSEAQFITFRLEGNKSCALLLADCYMSKSGGKAPTQKTGTSPYWEKDEIRLTSVETPVVQKGFSIQEEIANTMGDTCEKAVVLSGSKIAYVRYNVGDFKQLTGTYSVPDNGVGEKDEYTLTIYLDDDEENPSWSFNEKLNRGTEAKPFDIDVEDAQFVTFKLEGDRNCGLLISDAILSK